MYFKSYILPEEANTMTFKLAQQFCESKNKTLPLLNNNHNWPNTIKPVWLNMELKKWNSWITDVNNDLGMYLSGSDIRRIGCGILSTHQQLLTIEKFPLNIALCIIILKELKFNKVSTVMTRTDTIQH